MRIATLVLVAMLGAAAWPAVAQTADRPQADDRYVLAPAGEGYLRLDRQNGRVAECSLRNDSWRCVPVPDAQLALEAEIARLAGEVASLRAENARLSGGTDSDRPGTSPRTLPETAPGTPPSTEDGRPRFSPEEEAELDKALDFTEQAMRRFFGLMKTLRDEYEGMGK
ncbi:hypothetical protein [Stappia sp. MMSF_3263]|uniref:hypothetical protein n=1 Tax=Stappia sp. MMSF_3263 TaxID=3046693 RepID=UPI00273E61B2|nr:hypothetical protein [Stappia sp. MMSF_3263]